MRDTVGQSNEKGRDNLMWVCDVSVGLRQPGVQIDPCEAGAILLLLALIAKMWTKTRCDGQTMVELHGFC